MRRRSLRRMAALIALAAASGAMIAPAGVVHADGSTWTTVFYDGFDSDFGAGGFAAYNGGRYMTYDGMRDSTGKGLYDTSRVLSAKGGVLTWNLRTDNGQPLVAVISPWTASVRNLTSERVSFRFRVRGTVPGYKIAPLLWPVNNIWANGEIDFPETSELSTSSAYYAAVFSPNPGGSRPKPATKRQSGIPASGSGWHTAVLTRTPSSVTVQLDDWSAAFTSNLPTVAMRFVFQVETKIEGGKPAANTTGSVELDWLKIEVPGTATRTAVAGTTADRGVATTDRSSSAARSAPKAPTAASSPRRAAQSPSARTTVRPAASTVARTATPVPAPAVQADPTDPTVSAFSSSATERAPASPGLGLWPAAGGIGLVVVAATAVGLSRGQRRRRRLPGDSSGAWTRPPSRAIAPPETNRG